MTRKISFENRLEAYIIMQCAFFQNNVKSQVRVAK